MPSSVRNFKGDKLNSFKMTLDQVLETTPDCPPLHGLYPAPINPVTSKNSNCLIEWSKYLKLSSRYTEEIVPII